MPLKSIDTQLSESAIDLNSACWEISTKEDRINEIERTTGYVHVTCAKDYLSVKIKELLINYEKTHKNQSLTVEDLVILDIPSQPLYWIFYPKNSTSSDFIF